MSRGGRGGREAVKTFGRVDVLVNCAGVNPRNRSMAGLDPDRRLDRVRGSELLLLHSKPGSGSKRLAMPFMALAVARGTLKMVNMVLHIKEIHYTFIC